MNSISLCVIAKNASLEFQNLLDSALPHVDELVVVLGGKSNDNTEEIARKHTDKVFPFTWVDSFAAARNESFKYATSDWLLWLDTDDILLNGNLLPDLVAGVSPDITMIDLPYLYARDEYGNLTTTFTRERLIRRSSNPIWMGRVHEVVFSQGLQHRARNTDVLVNHNPLAAKPDPIERNLRLLQLQWKDYLRKAPDCVAPNRTASLLGFQYFAKRDLEKAIHWFKEYLKYESQAEHPWNESAWQAMCYIAISYRLKGDFKSAMEWDLKAITVISDWADPYIGLMEDCNGLQQWESAINWYNIALTKSQADPQVFVNPMQYTFNMPLGTIEPLIRLGKPEEALSVVDECLSKQPKNSTLLAQKDALETNLIPASNMANAILSFAQYVDPELHPDIFKMAPNLPKQFPVIAEKLLGPTYLKRSLLDRVVIFCGNVCPEPWGPTSIDEGGIGGSETAVIRVSQELAKLGYKVDIYNNCQYHAGSYNGVNYWPYEWYNNAEPALLFVSWRIPRVAEIVPNGERKWLWLHDLHYGQELRNNWARYYNRIMGVSEWHNNYLKMQYPYLDSHPGMIPTSNGIDYERFEGTERRVPSRLIYSSSPDRGLMNLLALMPWIRSVIHDVELHVYYGTKYLGDVQKSYLEQAYEYYGNKLSIPITVHGRIPQKQLAREFMKSSLWLYPTDFCEVSCITAMESMASGTIPLTVKLGALPETIGDGGITVPAYANSGLGTKMLIGHAVNILQNKDVEEELRNKALTHKSPSWSDVAMEWHTKLQDELSV